MESETNDVDANHYVFADSHDGSPQSRGRARAEIERRSRGWQEAQAKIQRDFEMEMFNAAADNEVKRKKFEAAQLDKQIAADRVISSEQLAAATSAATAASRTVWATWAAVFAALLSAIGTVIQA